MAEPFSTADREAQTKTQSAAIRRRVLAYKRCFSTESGRAVLADLKAKFGFDRCEAESETLSDNIIARRTCMKLPIYHIERMRAHTFSPKRNHHEDPSAPPP